MSDHDGHTINVGPVTVDRHEDYLLTVAIREALGEPT